MPFTQVVVNEDWVARAIMHIVEKEKYVVEGAGATAVACLLGGLLPNLKGKKWVYHDYHQQPAKVHSRTLLLRKETLVYNVTIGTAWYWIYFVFFIYSICYTESMHSLLGSCISFWDTAYDTYEVNKPSSAHGCWWHFILMFRQVCGLRIRFSL